MVMNHTIQYNSSELVTNRMHLSKLEIPDSISVTDSEFPVQNVDKIGHSMRVVIKSQEADIHPGVHKDYVAVSCIVLRYDTTIPYKFIGWVRETDNIVVADSRIITESVINSNKNDYHFLLQETHEFYINGSEEYKEGFIIKADAGNTKEAIICEYLDETTVRFVSAYEVAAIFTDYKSESEYHAEKGSIRTKIEYILANYNIFKEN